MAHAKSAKSAKFLKPPNTRNTRNFCAPRDHENWRGGKSLSRLTLAHRVRLDALHHRSDAASFNLRLCRLARHETPRTRRHEKSRNVRNGELGRGMRVWAKCKEIFYNLTKILYCYSCQNYNTFVIQLTSCRRENQCKSRKSKVKSDLKSRKSKVKFDTKSRKSKVCALNSTSEKLQNVIFRSKLKIDNFKKVGSMSDYAKITIFLRIILSSVVCR